MHYPKVLFLDEPTLGLDAQTRRAIWEHVKKINKSEKITIILTTHYMEEADYLCRRVAIMDHGKILTIGTPKKLKTSMGTDIVLLKVKKPGEARKLLEREKWVEKIKKTGSSLHISLKKGETKIPALLRILDKSGVLVLSVELHKPTLEDVFIRFTGRKLAL